MTKQRKRLSVLGLWQKPRMFFEDFPCLANHARVRVRRHSKDVGHAPQFTRSRVRRNRRRLATTWVAHAVEDPYLVEVLVYDETAPTTKVIEIWSDGNHVIRDIGPHERKHEKCGPNANCSSAEPHCRTLPGDPVGKECHYCMLGTATNSFCWPVNKFVCSTDGGESITCGARMKAVCVYSGIWQLSCESANAEEIGTCALFPCVP